MYAGVPSTWPVCVCDPVPAVIPKSLRVVRKPLFSPSGNFAALVPPAVRILASPQSMTWTSPKAPTIRWQA